MLRNGPFLKHIRLFVAMIAACATILFTGGIVMAQSTGTSVALSGTVTSTVSAPRLMFSTPPPVREEEALTSGFRNVPSVFPGVDDYHAIRAQSTLSSSLTSGASKPIDAVQSVVQIFRCDQFGCDTPVGSGVIIHPSGLILTAYHVLLENPNNLRSREYEDFVIALTENPRIAPFPLYRARSVADLDELDIALLAIDRNLDEYPIDAEVLNLPALPFADVDQLFADTLHVLGFPLDGGDAVNYTPATFASFDDNGQLIVVDKDLGKGNSGGPALVLQDGRLAIAGLVIRGRTTRGRLGQDGLLRAIDQVSGLGWTPDFERALGQGVRAGVGTVNGEDVLQLSVDLSIYDLVGDTLRLLFYVAETATGRPWQPDDADGPLVIWADLAPTDFVDAQQVALTIPVADLGIAPDQLTFFGMLWDRENGEPMWDAGREGVRVSGRPIAMVSETRSVDKELVELEIEPKPTPTRRLTATRTPTRNPTKTPRTIATPTPDQEATEVAIETAVAATLEALETPTPTANPVAVRLTEVAAERKIQTPTRTAVPPETLTWTPQPTATSQPAAAPSNTPTSLGTNCTSDAHTVFAPLWQQYRGVAGCPTTASTVIPTIAEQLFQGGHVFWRNDTDDVYVVYDRARSGASLRQGTWKTDPSWKWDGSNPDGIGLTPPSGFIEPKRGFGWLWRVFLGGESGPLGWAIDQEYGFDGTGRAQYFEEGLMFKGSDPKVYLLLYDGSFIAR